VVFTNIFKWETIDRELKTYFKSPKPPDSKVNNLKDICDLI
jgi:hypothetical protein